MVSFKAISRPKTRPVTSPARVFITLWRVIGSVRHSQPRAQGITLHQAGSLERLWLVAWYKAVLQKWFSCILLASQMTSEDTEPGGAMKTNACFLLVKIRWPVPSASQTLLELCFLLWHCHFSTAPRFYEAIMLSYRDSHTQWPAVPAGHPICSLSRIPLCPSTCSAVQEQMCRVKIHFFFYNTLALKPISLLWILISSVFACLSFTLCTISLSYKTLCCFPFSCSFDWKCYVMIPVNCLTWHEQSDSIHRFLCCDTKTDGNQWNWFVLSLHAPQNGSRECLTVTAFSSECASLQNVYMLLQYMLYCVHQANTVWLHHQ